MLSQQWLLLDRPTQSLLLPGDRDSICGLCPYTGPFCSLTSRQPHHPLWASQLLFTRLTNSLHSVPSALRTHRVPIFLVGPCLTLHVAHKVSGGKWHQRTLVYCKGQFTKFLAQQIAGGDVRTRGGACGEPTETFTRGRPFSKGQVTKGVDLPVAPRKLFWGAYISTRSLCRCVHTT